MFSIDKFMSVNTNTSKKFLLGSSRKTKIISATALFLVVCAFGGAASVAPLAPDPANLPIRAIVEELPIPTLSEQVAALEKPSQHFVREEKVRAGDTLSALLIRLGINDNAAAAFIKSDNAARSVLQLKAGKLVQAQTKENGELEWLSTTIVDNHDTSVKNIVIQREGSSFKTAETSAILEKRVEMRTGEIKSSLFAATDASQIPDNIAVQIVDMFATDIDFASDLKRGDRFDVVYETFWQNGEYVRAGRILAAEFHNAGATYQSVWYDEPSTKQGGGYYSFDGKSLKKAFLKSPLEFSRISSVFSMRVHPISGQWKQHKGVDFAAATGTPIRASGDGVIEFIGGQNGYGNLVVIKHWGNYSTAYAHMSRFGGDMKKGMKVSQGDVIGYVGSTGWATGPHLHYEFRVNNEPRDPLSVDIPNAQPLAGAELQRFHAVANDMSHRITLLNSENKGLKLASK
jgi:murein DD-endopeptidase MepM/ murein hydrolase activator NlpD